MDDTEKISNNLKNSLESTVKGLQMFSRSLEKSGMNESIPEYKKLRYILIQQRLWSQNHKQEMLQPLWDEVSKHATKIVETLTSFAEVMNELKDINTINHTDEDDSCSQKSTITNYTEEQHLIITLLSRPRYFTLEQISMISNLDKKKLIGIIEELSEKGIIEKKRHVKKIQIKLNDQIIRITDPPVS